MLYSGDRGRGYGRGCEERGGAVIIKVFEIYSTTVKPLYCGHHWDPSNCPAFRDVLNSGAEFLISFLMINTCTCTTHIKIQLIVNHTQLHATAQ